MTETIFSKIIAGTIPATIEYQDDRCMAFHDASPQAPVHLLLIPKRSIASLMEVSERDADLLGHMLVVATKLATQMGLETGYRLVVNCGRDGGQSVDHLHIHLLGGRSLQWPPG